MPEQNLLQFVKESGLNSLGKARLFIRCSLNEKCLGDYLNALQSQPNLTKQFYDEHSILHNEDQVHVLLQLLDSLKSIDFGIFAKDPQIQRPDYYSHVKLWKNEDGASDRRPNSPSVNLKSIEEWKNISTHMDLAKKLVRKGIPAAQRSNVWMSICFPSIILNKKDGLYKIISVGETVCEDDIQKDITRTLRNHEFFDRVETQQALSNVLRAYAVYNPTFGYQQGVGYIASLLLLQLEEEEAFWCLDYILRKYTISERSDMRLLQSQLYILDRLIQTHLPALFSYFKARSITPVYYASEWFSTLYIYNFDLELTYRIWDVLLIEDWRYLIKLALAILKLCHWILMPLEFEFSLKFLKNIGQDFLTIDELLREADSLDIDEEILQLANDFEHPTTNPIDV